MTGGARPLWLFCPAMRPEAGGGHVGRCVPLAKALVSLGGRAVFAVAPGTEAWIPYLRAAGLETAPVDGPTAAQVLAPGGVVVDDYRLVADDAALASWRAAAGRLCVFQDEGTTPCTLADAVVAPVLPDGGTVIGGIGHAIVDPSYANLSRLIAPAVGRILVTFGRRDSANASAIALRALEQAFAGGLEASAAIVVGGTAPHRAAVESLAQGMGVSIIVDAPGMHDLFQEADLVIGSGGVSLLERSCAGVPSVTVMNAENQRPLSRLVADHEATVLLGAVGEAGVGADSLAGAVLQLASDATARAAMSARARALVDGRAAERVARRLLALTA